MLGVDGHLVTAAGHDGPRQQVVEADGLLGPAVTQAQRRPPATRTAQLGGRDTDFRVKHLKHPEPLTCHDLEFPLLWHVHIVLDTYD